MTLRSNDQKMFDFDRFFVYEADARLVVRSHFKIQAERAPLAVSNTEDPKYRDEHSEFFRISGNTWPPKFSVEGDRFCFLNVSERVGEFMFLMDQVFPVDVSDVAGGANRLEFFDAGPSMSRVLRALPQQDKPVKEWKNHGSPI